ncbi:hypothetical protein PPERSA_10077 [Pseudocohnilembus persalinus]|uniref:Uncharacterized protein n=1 Tax=Pseudocohnilembus persalinus TaxID=266149 RepID=A0A0V0QK30_PSEPJ|nr:hypothetical protein PPERSA_10077 [Pseudocohnilembus persalinus]|eukprot:KRX02460.1 hypothetical protein PPERSA_10077 [Pseudocohnilembus persalinus]
MVNYDLEKYELDQTIPQEEYLNIFKKAEEQLRKVEFQNFTEFNSQQAPKLIENIQDLSIKLYKLSRYSQDFKDKLNEFVRSSNVLQECYNNGDKKYKESIKPDLESNKQQEECKNQGIDISKIQNDIEYYNVKKSEAQDFKNEVLVNFYNYQKTNYTQIELKAQQDIDENQKFLDICNQNKTQTEEKVFQIKEYLQQIQSEINDAQNRNQIQQQSLKNPQIYKLEYQNYIENRTGVYEKYEKKLNEYQLYLRQCNQMGYEINQLKDEQQNIEQNKKETQQKIETYQSYIKIYDNNIETCNKEIEKLWRQYYDLDRCFNGKVNEVTEKSDFLNSYCEYEKKSATAYFKKLNKIIPLVNQNFVNQINNIKEELEAEIKKNTHEIQQY